MGVKSFRDLVAWQKAMDLVAEIYQVTKAFRGMNCSVLSANCASPQVSVPSNIAEGRGRSSIGEFHLFLGHAMGHWRKWKRKS